MRKTPEEREPCLEAAGEAGSGRGLKPYRGPTLEALGDLRGTTLGGSIINIGDSQFPNTRP